MKSLRTHDVVYGGLTTSIVIILLYIGNYTKSSKLFFVISATYFAAIPYGVGGTLTGITAYFASAIIALILLPDKAYAVVFVILGIYPYIKGLSEKKVKRRFEFIIKYIWFNLSLAISYFIVNLITPIKIQGSLTTKIFIVLGAEIAFYVYDYIFTLFISVIMKNLRRNN